MDTIARGEKLEAVGTEIGLPRTQVSSATTYLFRIKTKQLFFFHTFTGTDGSKVLGRLPLLSRAARLRCTVRNQWNT